MTFSSAIRSLRDGNATKRPSWLGYIKRVDLTADNYEDEFSDLLPGLTPGSGGTQGSLEQAIAAGTYKLVFCYADGETEALYLFDASASNNVVKDGTAVKKGSATATVFEDFAPLTQFLFEAILQDDWEVGNTADYAAAASGSNEF